MRSDVTQKLKGAIDHKLMQNAKVFAVGSGGANNIYENLIRVGLGELTVVDFDTVDYSNLVTQGWYADQIGTPKVQALQDTLSRVSEITSPDVKLNMLEDDFLKMSEQELEELAGDADLLMFMCDDFFAQARGNRLALKLKKPAIFAIMYEKARCCEVTFTIPDVTPACHRCATSNRYKAYLEDGFQNDVGSEGSMIFQTHALNSVLGMLSLAILHNKTQGFEYSNWFGTYWDRNFLQLRLSPFHKEGLFPRVHDKPQTISFDSVWQKVEHEHPPKYAFCPDCGGHGDLRKAKITNTHLPLIEGKGAA